MLYKEDWAAAREKWCNYWKQQNTGRPLMHVVARKPEFEAYVDQKAPNGVNDDIICQGRYYTLPDGLWWKDLDDKYLNAKGLVERYHHFCQHHLFLAESFPNVDVSLGPGSTAAYLGSDVGFSEDTIWFKPCVEEDWDEHPEIKFDPENPWFKRHLQLVTDARKLAGDDFLLDMPDLMENLDVLSSLRGAQELMMDLIEDPDAVMERVEQVTRAYFPIYDAFYEQVKDAEGGNAFNCFQIWAPGRLSKLQCDASAMMSTEMFDDFVLDSLRYQTERLDYSMYHLDGPGAIKHLDSLMTLDKLNALQWTPGDAGPDGAYEEWYSIYDRVTAAGKSLWVKIYDGGLEGWIRSTDRLVQRYGTKGLFLWYPEMSLKEAEQLLDFAEKHWN